MHSGANQPLYLLSFDIDGTVAAPNQLIRGVYRSFLTKLQEIPGVEVVLNSGKSIHYLETNAARIGGRYIIANNGAACKLIGGETIIFGGGHEDLLALRKLLCLKKRAEGVCPIKVGNKKIEVAIEEGKHDMVLTLFTEPEWVTHRWNFAGGMDRHEVYLNVKELIKKHKLNLHVLEPHGDGAVDVVRLHNGRPINKATLPKLVRQIWPTTKNIRIAMYGDGANDVPGMTARGVMGITFPEADEETVQEPVLHHCDDIIVPLREDCGIVTKRCAWVKRGKRFHAQGGPIEGTKSLANLGFFDDLDKRIIKLCNKHLEMLH